MPRFSLSSLRSRAIILVLLALLPLLALTLYSYFDQRHLAIHEVQRDELVAARNLATVQETLIRSTGQLLTTLARMPQVQRCDRDACNPLFAGLLEKNSYYAVIGAADSEGWVFASAPATKERFTVNYRLWFQQVLQTRAFFVGDPILGRISQKYSIILSHPILDDKGRLQGVIYAGLDLSWLGNLLAKSDFPANTAMALTDASWKVLYRYPEPLKYIGRMLPDSLIKVMNRGDEGVAEGVGLPGDERLFAFARLSPPWQDLRVAIGLPRSWALGQVNRDLQRNLLWLGLVGILALAAARGDLIMIRQVLTNLLINAIKFTKDRRPALIQVSGWSEEQDNVYCVKDNGVGFDMKYVDKIYEFFQRLHPDDEFEGTGVGLAIVKRIIVRHGGRLWAEGKVNEGANFCFTIPKKKDI